MKYLSLFSGIGGFELGIQKAYELQKMGIKPGNSTNGKSKSSQYSTSPLCIGYSEIDKYAIQIYEKHFNHKNYGDATKIDTRELPDFDCLVGGFPCQAFSIAGKRKGFDDTRGTLFFDIARILADKKPKLVVLENVKGLLSHNGGNTFTTIIRVLTDLGYFVEWQVLNAKNFGVPQNRERVFIIGYLGGQPRRKVFPITGSGGETKGLVYAQKADKEIARIYDIEGIAPTQHLKTGGWQETKIRAVLTPDREKKRQNGRRMKESGEPSFTLTGQDIHGVAIIDILERKMDSLGRKRPVNYAKNISNEMKIRRLTPLECERLMAYPEHKNYAILELCYDQAKSYVNAVLQNPKLQKLVLSVENKEWKELAEYVEKNLQLKNQLNENTAQENVSLKNTTLENPQSLSVNSVEKKSRKLNQELEEDSAPLNVLIDITEGRIILNGKEGLQVKELEQIAHQDGQDVVRLFGKEIMQLAEDVISDSLTEKIKPLMSTISSDSETKKLDTMLVILYFYVTNVINGFIQEKIPNKNISLGFRTINGWTEGFSDTQRYKTLGNGIVSNVVAEVFRRLLK